MRSIGKGILTGLAALVFSLGSPAVSDGQDIDWGPTRVERNGPVKQLPPYSLDAFTEVWVDYHNGVKTRVVFENDSVLETYWSKDKPFELSPKVSFDKSVLKVTVGKEITYEEKIQLPPGVTLEVLDGKYVKITDTEGGKFVEYGNSEKSKKAVGPYVLLKVSEEIRTTVDAYFGELLRGSEDVKDVPYNITFSATIPHRGTFDTYASPQQQEWGMEEGKEPEIRDVVSWDEHIRIDNGEGVQGFLDYMTANHLFRWEVRDKKTKLPGSDVYTVWGPNRLGEYELREQGGRRSFLYKPEDESIRLGYGWEYSGTIVGSTTIDGTWPNIQVTERINQAFLDASIGFQAYTEGVAIKDIQAAPEQKRLIQVFPQAADDHTYMTRVLSDSINLTEN
jgi:hypothetical protein